MIQRSGCLHVGHNPGPLRSTDSGVSLWIASPNAKNPTRYSLYSR